MVARDTIWNDHPGFSLGRRLPCSAAACLEILAVSREGQNNSYFYVFFALKQFNTAEISLLTWPDLSSATPMQAINLTLTGCNMLVESYIYTYIHTSHHITSHHITPHHTTPHHTTSHHITSHHITPHHTTPHHTTPHHTTPHHITSHHITPHHTTPHHITSHHIILYHITSHHIHTYYIYITCLYTYMLLRQGGGNNVSVCFFL